MSVMARRRSLILLAAASAVTPVVTARGMVTASGDFYSEVLRLRGLAFAANTNLYVPPTASQFGAFKDLALTLSAGNYALADTQASALNYDLVSFTDTASSRSYFELRERLVGGQQQTGWGTYVFNPAGTLNAMVEVPHVLFDGNTENVGALTFQFSNAQFFLMAGAQRNANGQGTADVAHLSNSIFQAVHEAWNGPSGQTTAWQVHGFDETSVNFPSDAMAVMADGAGGVTSKMINLDRQLAAHGLTAYAYNTLNAADAGNKLINTSSAGVVYSGPTFSALGATTNVQSAYSRSIGGTFVHVELAQAVRFNSANRSLAASGIALAMADSNVNIKLWDGELGNGSWTANNSTGQNWSPDGIPDASSAILFDNSLVATLPASMNLIRTTAPTTVQYLVWNSNDSSELHAATTLSAHSVLAFNGDGAGNTTPLLSMGALAVDNLLQFRNTNTSGGTSRTVLQLNTSGAFNVTNPGATLQVDCVIQESGGSRTLEKTGDGTLLLTGSNTFTGGVVVSGGVLSVTGTTPLGTVPGLSPAFITLNGGTLRYTASTAITSVTNRGMTVTANGGTFELTSPTAVITFNGQITGPGTLTKAGPGEFILASNNNASGTGSVAPFTGGVAVTGGTLTIPALANAPASPAAPTVQFTIDGGAALRWSGASAINFSANRLFSLGETGGTLDLAPANFTIAGKISGSSSASLTKLGSGNLLLTGSNTFGGGVIVNGGTLSVDAGAALGAAPPSPATNVTLNNSSTLRWVGGDAALNTNRNILLGAGTPSINVDANSSFTIPGVIDGPSASLTKTGTGTLVLSGSNTYTGGTIVNAGVLSVSMGTNLGAAPTVPTPASLTLNGGTLRATAGFTLHGNRGVLLGASGGAVDVTADNPFSMAGTVSGSGSLTKTGTGTLVLDPGNTYTGPTTILAGTLSTSAASSVGTGGAGDPLPLTIANNATLQVTSTYTTARPITIAAGGATIDVTDSAVYTRTTAITGTDPLTKSGTGRMVVPNIRLGSIHVAGGQLAIAANGTDAGTSLITSLAVDAGASLDLADNKLVIDTDAANLLSTLTSLRSALLDGRNAGAWTGTGVLSSIAAANPNQLVGIAYAQTAQLGLTAWGGLATDNTAVATKLAYYGDANMDGVINPDDFTLIDRAAAGRSYVAGNFFWTDGDFNYDGVIDQNDYLLIDRSFALQSGPLSPSFLAQREQQFGDAYVQTLIASVPEPTTLSLVAVGALPFLSRRRRIAR